jgi:cytochrome c biogenesis factor
MLYPERRFFITSQITQTVVALQSSPLRDLYVVYDGRSPDTGKPEIHAHLNPLVKWIWFGGIVVVLGTGLAMLPNRRAVLVLRAATETSWGEGVAPESPSAVGAVAPRADTHD